MSRKVNRRGSAHGWHSVAWRVSGVEQMCFKRSFEGNHGGRITDGSRYMYIVPGRRCRDCKWVFVEVRGGVRPVQSDSSARAQCPQWLTRVQTTTYYVQQCFKTLNLCQMQCTKMQATIFKVQNSNANNSSDKVDEENARTDSQICGKGRPLH